VRAEHQTARELAEQCFSLAQRVHDPTLLLEAHFALGVSLLWLGEVVPARTHLEQGIALYDPQEHRALAPRAGIDLAVWCLSHAAQALWALGYPDQALRRNREALILAQGLSHPPSLAAVLFYVAYIHAYRRETQVAQEQAEAAMALASEQGFPQWLTVATMVRGWALAMRGQAEEGAAQIRQALAAWRAMGAGMAVSHWLVLLAEAYGHAGQAGEGLRLLAEAVVHVDSTGEQKYKQLPLSLRWNVLPVELKYWPLVLPHEHSACALVELMQIGKAPSGANPVLHHTPEAFNRIQVVTTVGWKQMQPKLFVPVSQRRRELFRPVDATAVGDHDDLFPGVAKEGHHLMDILAQPLRIKMGNDLIEDFRGPILDGTDDAEQHAAGDAAPRAIPQPRLAFEAFFAFDLALAQGTYREASALGFAPPACPGEGKTPHDRFIFIEQNDLAPTSPIL